MAKRKKKTHAPVDPGYLDKQRAALRRTHRIAVFFNEKEIEALREYMRMSKSKSQSSIIRQATMEHVLETLGENHPTLF